MDTISVSQAKIGEEATLIKQIQIAKAIEAKQLDAGRSKPGNPGLFLLKIMCKDNYTVEEVISLFGSTEAIAEKAIKEEGERKLTHVLMTDNFVADLVYLEITGDVEVFFKETTCLFADKQNQVFLLKDWKPPVLY